MPTNASASQLDSLLIGFQIANGPLSIESSAEVTASKSQLQRIVMSELTNTDSPTIPAEEFVRRLRRYPRDKLLLSIAKETAKQLPDSTTSPGQPDPRGLRDIREAYLFQVAGLCLACCNNYRNTVPNDAVVDLLANSLHLTRGPWFDNPLDTVAWQQTLSRIAYLQLPVQQSVPESWVRSYCLFGDNPVFGEPIAHISKMRERIGATFSDVLRIGFLLYAVAQQFNGAFPKALLLRRELLDLFVSDLSTRTVECVFDRWFAKPVDQLAVEAKEAFFGSNDPWSFNPLVDRPIAVLNDGRCVIPSARAIMNRVNPQGLYFIVRDALEADSHPGIFQEFTSSLGQRFERYIGEQLKQLEFASISSEITYDHSQKSVDFLVETPELIVLVETKSAAPDASTRSGLFPDSGDLQRKLQRACTQIGKSSELIKSGHQMFPTHNSRELRGLVISREQYFNLPMPSISDLVKPVEVPANIVSSQQFERVLGTLNKDSSIGQTLLNALATDTNSAKYDLIPISESANPLLGDIYRQWNPFRVAGHELLEQ